MGRVRGVAGMAGWGGQGHTHPAEPRREKMLLNKL